MREKLQHLNSSTLSSSDIKYVSTSTVLRFISEPTSSGGRHDVGRCSSAGVQ